jgi:ABC-type phosphate transport system substrate-binding protein
MRIVCLTVVSLTLAATIPASANEPSAPFKVIVNAKVSGRVIPRDVLAQIFLGKVTRWGDTRSIAAVDLSSTSTVRQAFSVQVLGMPIDGVKHHWLQMMVAGQRPPLSKASDEDVITFVAADPGGVGYVSHSTPLPATVREVAVQ